MSVNSHAARPLDRAPHPGRISLASRRCCPRRFALRGLRARASAALPRAGPLARSAPRWFSQTQGKAGPPWTGPIFIGAHSQTAEIFKIAAYLLRCPCSRGRGAHGRNSTSVRPGNDLLTLMNYLPASTVIRLSPHDGGHHGDFARIRCDSIHSANIWACCD